MNYVNLIIMFHLFSAVDMVYGAVYCFACCDYMYDETFEVIARKFNRKCAKSLGMKIHMLQL